MGILIGVTFSSGMKKVNIALTKFNLEARFVTYFYFSLFELGYIFARTISNLLLDKDSIPLNDNINAHII